MSTFDGILEEFPEIQIDYFRKSPERPAPLACFLSHVHSDHLQGLESFRAPFIYCSPATRELLLRIEKYPHRINFNKGILESRRLHYKHLAKLLRPIPLNTPTEIELTPRRRIRATLFDANHCTGAVMFLIEGDGKGILYTGDIRAEPWWINSLVRHPALIPYTLGRKRLDKLYLDTTFAHAANIFRQFPSKAEGLAELWSKVEAYPDDTVFYFRAWTFGYEDVWLTLASALNAKVHVDRYQMGLYRSLTQGPGNRGVGEAPALCGFELGNRVVAGVLTDSTTSRIHSCEPGVSCSMARQPNTVYIVPVVNRMADGAEIPEVGAGGGVGDLYQTHELELPDESALAELEKLCFQHIHDEQVLLQMRQTLQQAFQSKKALSLDSLRMKEEEDISLKRLITILGRGLQEGRRLTPQGGAGKDSKLDLPNTIRFPYSRHSSYTELCQFVAAFRPKDIHPCTVDPASWNEDVSIRRLFGHLCSGYEFSHDLRMRETITETDEDHEGPRGQKRAHCDGHFSPRSTQETGIAEAGASTDQSQSHSQYPVVIDYEGKVTGRQPQLPESSNSSSLQIATQVQPGQPETNQPLNLSPSPPDAERAKRNKIRQTRLYLEEHTEPGLFSVGPLPSSWATGEEDTFDLGQKEESSTTEPGKAQSLASLPSTASPEPNIGMGTKSANISGDGKTGFAERNPNPDTNTQPDNAHQTDSQFTDTLSLSLSLSESAFASPPGTTPGDSQPREVEPRSSTRSPARIRRSTRARIAAYLAARADTYADWADVSLVSAGDNHAEEEIEL